MVSVPLRPAAESQREIGFRWSACNTSRLPGRMFRRSGRGSMPRAPGAWGRASQVPSSKRQLCVRASARAV